MILRSRLIGTTSRWSRTEPIGIMEQGVMCRNIKPLFNFEPPVTEAEILDAALQFVRKISGFQKPSMSNEAAFQRAVDDISRVSKVLLSSLETNAPPKNRDVEAEKRRARAAHRYSA